MLNEKLEQTGHSQIESDLARRMSAFDDLIQRTSHALNAEDVLDLICHYILKIIDSDRASLILLTEDPTKGRIFSLLTSPEGRANLNTGVVEQISDFAVWLAIQKKRLVCWERIEQYNYSDFKRLSAAGFRTAMQVPLITAGRVIGTLNTTRKEVEPYSLIEQSLMTALGSYLAAIFENRKLFQNNKQLIQDLEGSKQELEKKNLELDQSLRKVEETNSRLVEIHRRADRIFSALTLALPGRVLDGKYRLGEKIGSGGFGAVFRSQDLVRGGDVAVKVFRPKPGNDSAAAAERFRLEGVASSQLKHPNIVAVIESGITSDGIAYLVMELLSGIPLSAALYYPSRQTIRFVLNVARQIASALARAHGRGVIHRDIKPDNIFIHRCESGEIIKVLDFGVSKLVEENALREENLLSHNGGGPGTPAYMAPERLSGETYDGKSDIFSLGVVLYQMVSGRLPTAFNAPAVVKPGLEQEEASAASAPSLGADLPVELESLILSLLNKNPSRRPTALELSSQLEQVCKDCEPFLDGRSDAILPRAIPFDAKSTITDQSQPTLLIQHPGP